MSDLLEIKAALLAAKENTELPVLCTMTFTENGRTFTGCPVSAAAITLEGLGADAVGINCSLGPKEMLPLIREVASLSSLPVIASPNAGLPDVLDGRTVYPVGPEAFAGAMREIAQAGAHILGGCCGTTPEYIACLKQALANVTYTPQKKDEGPVVCSPSTIVRIDGPRIIGERINPTVSFFSIIILVG